MNSLYQKFIYCVFLLTIFCAPSLYAQVSFTGKVIDEKGDVAIQNASVYFNNTAIATQTNARGEFSFNNILFFNTELVIYSPGYELVVFKPTAAQLVVKKFVFKMQAKQKAAILKGGPVGDSKKLYLDAFFQGLLGLTQEAAQCTVSNAANIRIGAGNANSGFVVVADTALVIVNNMLGYTLHYNLEQFLFDGYSRRSYFTGYCRYEALGDDKQFQLNRNHCYFGSSQHFYRSLTANKLYEEGFGVFMKDTTKAPTSIHNGEADDAGDRFLPITAQKILWIDSTNNFSIGVKGKIVVQYNRNPYSKPYLSKILSYLEGDLKKGMEANIEIKTAPVELTTIGVPVDDNTVDYGGFWSYEKLANTLPLDYKPDLKPLK